MYEVTLGTGGIMQLGWATHACQFSNEEGVGDSPDSYAFDGKRVRKWNIRSVPPPPSPLNDSQSAMHALNGLTVQAACLRKSHAPGKSRDAPLK